MRSKLRDISINHKLVAVGMIVLFARIIIDLLLFSRGYYYGNDPDTFWRLGLSWKWSRDPFFIFGYWTPFQFWISGLTFRLLEPMLAGSTPIVPVAWNHLFFMGSAIITYRFSREIGGFTTAVVSLAILVTMASDIMATFSGVVEPLLVFCGIVFSFALFRLFQGGEQRHRGFILVMAASTLVASATHYMGWYLVAIFLVLLIFVSTSKILNVAGHFHLAWSDIAIAGAIALMFPITWVVANYLKFGSPFNFIIQARSFHAEYARETLAIRSTASLKALWQAEPILVALAIPTLIHQANRNRRSLIFIAPGLAFLGMLAFSGLLGFAVPDLQTRYVLLFFWLIVPIVSTSLIEIGNTAAPFSLLVPIVITLVLAVYGLGRAFEFQNWVDVSARHMVFAVESHIARSSEPLEIFIEPQSCLYPTAGITYSLTRPDWVEPIYNPGQVSRVVEPEKYDLALVVNPLSMNAFISSHHAIAEEGDYVLFIDDQEFPREQIGGRLPEGWSPISDKQLLHVSSGGTIFFAFEDKPEEMGRSVGISKELEVQPNSCHVISADIQDWYQSNDQPWVILQQLVVNDVVLWSHDVGGDGSCLQEINHYLMPTTSEVRIELRAVAFGEAHPQTDWDSMSLTGIRNLKVKPCDQSAR